MIGFTITDNKKNKLALSAPNSWEELTIQQIIDIETDGLQKEGLIKLFCILTGVEFEIVAESTDRSLFARIREVCNFVTNVPDWDNIPFPNELEIEGKRYTCPKKVDKLMHGQIELITQTAEADNLINIMPRVVAIIMQPTVDGGKYDGDRVDVLEQELRSARGFDVFGFAQFFFQKLKVFLSIGINNSRVYHEQMIPSSRYYTDWLKVIDLEGIES